MGSTPRGWVFKKKKKEYIYHFSPLLWGENPRPFPVGKSKARGAQDLAGIGGWGPPSGPQTNLSSVTERWRICILRTRNWVQMPVLPLPRCASPGNP